MGASRKDYKVTLNGKECNVTLLNYYVLMCNVSSLSEEERKQKIEIKVCFSLSQLKGKSGIGFRRGLCDISNFYLHVYVHAF